MKVSITNQLSIGGEPADDVLPQRIAVIGQGASWNTNATKKRATTEQDIGFAFGFGTPIHLACRSLLQHVGNITVTAYPLLDDPAATAATASIGTSGAVTDRATARVRVGGEVSDLAVFYVGDDPATILARAINGALAMPVTATVNGSSVDLTAKWGGTSANDLVVEVVGEVPGVTFTVANLSGGATNPDVTAALDQVGDVWETMIVNCLEIDDTVALDTYAAWNEGRWCGYVIPAVVFTGNTVAPILDATAISDARPTDRTNAQLVAPGSVTAPFIVAAEQVAQIARVANERPAASYDGLVVGDIRPGADAIQWTGAVFEQALERGSSTSRVEHAVTVIGQVLTFYHPVGEDNPPYKYVVDIVKIQNTHYTIRSLFESREWDGAPLTPNE